VMLVWESPARAGREEVNLVLESLVHPHLLLYLLVQQLNLLQFFELC
jgi:hypothetical protein